MAAAHKRCSLVFVHKIDGILKIQCRIKMKKGRWNVPFHYELRFTDSGYMLFLWHSKSLSIKIVQYCKIMLLSLFYRFRHRFIQIS